ncbi:two-component regulator propeller domain-containing protein [Nibrella saemangeumensis]
MLPLRPLFSILLAFYSVGALAQFDDLAFEHYTTDQGLSHDWVNCILKDRQGFLWFGTENGLNRFDGLRFRPFQTGKVDGTLPSSIITALAQDSSGTIWAGTDKGLCLFDPERLQFSVFALTAQPQKEANDPRIYGIALDRTGYAWVTTAHYIYKLHLRTRQVRVFRMLNNPTRAGVLPTVDHQNRLWLFFGGAVFRFDEQTGRYRHYIGRSESSPKDPVLMSSAVYADSKGQLWAPSWNAGLFRYDAAADAFVVVDKRIDLGQSITEDRSAGESFLWIGGGMSSLAQYWPERKQVVSFTYNPAEPFSHNEAKVTAIFSDPQTKITWIATENGIEKYDPNSVRFKRKILPLPADHTQFNDVVAVTEDRFAPNSYWIGVWGNGLYRWNRETDSLTRFTDRNSPLPTSEVFTITQDDQGVLWLGLKGSLTRFDPRKNSWRHYRPFPALPNVNHKILYTYTDERRHLWLGMNYAGLWEFDPATGQFKQWPLPTDGLKRVVINGITQDAQHRIWAVGTAGLYCVDPVRGTVTKQALGAHKNQEVVLNAVCVDRRQRIWVAGEDALMVMNADGQRIRQYRVNHELQGRPTGLTVDRAGHIWVATDNYLHRIDGNTGTIRHFDKSDGLLSNSFGPAFTQNRAGEIFLGTRLGFNYVDPARLTTNQQIPGLAITDIHIANDRRTIPATGNLVIQPDENAVAVQFAALNFSQPYRNQYKYRLVGFDKDWQTTDQPRVSYTNLSPGTYTLQLMASNNDGVWNPKPLELGIDVIPPVEQRWWFRGLLLLVLGGAVYGGVRYRQQQQDKIRRIRDRIATDLHDDMGSTLSSIRIISDVLQRQLTESEPVAGAMLQKISENATHLSESMQDIIWSIKSDNDTLEDVVTRMMEFAVKPLEARQIKLKTHISARFDGTRLNPDQRRTLFLIFKEVVNNAIKYAACTQIDLLISLTGPNLSMVIRDNGIGFDPATVQPGNGLQNLQRRAQDMGGRLQVVSAPAKGTIVELTFKIT